MCPLSAVDAVDDDIQAFSVDGLSVVLKHNPANEIVAIRLYVRGGTSNLDAQTSGAEFMWGCTARRGTSQYPKKKLNAELARLGASLGTAAADDYTVLYLRCLRRNFSPAWDLFVDFLLHPLLEKAELEIVRQQMQMEIRQRSEHPDGALGELARLQVYAGHPYASHPYGTEEAVARLDADMLRQHMAGVLTRSNSLLVAAGNLGRDELESRTAAAFSSLAPGSGAVPLPPALVYPSSHCHLEARSLPTNYMIGQFEAPALADPDYDATLVAMSVLRDRFFEEVRTKRNLSYAPSAGLGHDAANLGTIYVTAVDPRTTMQVMRDEMRRLRDEAIPERELEDKIRVFVTRYYMQSETNQAQAAFLASYEILAGNWKKSRDFVARLEALAPEDIKRAARATLRHIQYVYLGDPALVDPDVFVDP